MSRTTTALKRLAVPGLAAVTMIAGVPALVATSANAAAGDTITISPTADSASAGTCNPFTVTVKNSAGQPATSTVDVTITERNNGTAASSDTFSVDFCTTSTGTAPQAPSDRTTTGTTGSGNNINTDVTRAEFTPNAQGQFTFGVVGTEAGIADIVAFVDNNNDDDIDTGENFATATKTFTAGTAADVRTIDAEPETQSDFVGEVVTVTATLRNAAGDTVANVTPTADITSGPNAATTPSCTASNNDGVSTCTYTAGAAGTDAIVVYLNQTNADNNPSTPDTSGADAGEPQDQVQATISAAPTGLVVDITCGDATSPRTSAEDCINPLSDGTEVFTATVTGPDGTDAGTDRDPAAGVIVNFTVSGNAFDANDTETVSPTSATTNAAGVATTTLTNSKTTEDEVITVTATIRGQAAGAGTADSGTKTWNTPAASEARYVDLTPNTATTTVGTFREFSARVTNVNGEAVPGVTVTFSETGAGAFRNGSSSVTAVTDASGVARAEVSAAASEAGGTQTVTATLPSGTQCGAAAGTGGTPAAGNCSDSSTNNYVAAGASPTPTGSPSGPPNAPCTNAASVTLERSTIIATGSAGVTVRATPNSVVDLYAYTRPSTTYRVVRSAEVGADGTAQFRIVPPANTRLYAQQRGCNASPSVVLNVRTALSLNVTRTGTRAYRFFGDSLPARPGGLIVSLYRVTNDGRQILTAQTRASATTGDWVINRVFTGTGRFGFVVRTGQDLQNAPGSSNVRSLLIF